MKRQPQAWLHAKVRLQPQLLVQAPPWVRGMFDHAWAPMSALAQQASCLPSSLWDYLLDSDGGFVSICNGQSRYVPGAALIGRRQVANAAFVSVEDLAAKNEQPLHAIGHLTDHYLGCSGQPDSLWLSEGGGVTVHWRQAGARLQRLFALGYGVDEIARSNSRDYFAQSMALYCLDRKRLNVADPQIYKWLRATLWNPASWRGQIPDQG